MDELIFLISLNLGPAAGPVQAITIALQLPIIETRVTILLGLARADVAGAVGGGPGTAESAPLRPNAGIQAAIRVVKAGAQSRTHRSKTIPCDHMEPFSI